MAVDRIVAGLVVLGMLIVGGAATSVGPWYRDLDKPKWNPPNWAFAPAWTIILGLAGWSGALAWEHGAAPDRAKLVALFGANVVLHQAWSPLFFNLKRPDWALYEVPFLWLSVLALMILEAPLSPLASLLLAPYLVWVGFAAVLNYAIVRRNSPFGARAKAAPA